MAAKKKGNYEYSPVSGNPLRKLDDGSFKDDLTQDVFSKEYLDEVGDNNSNVERDPYENQGREGRNFATNPSGSENVVAPAPGTGKTPAPKVEDTDEDEDNS